jgi:succinyl-diaminopimelate desuccinylase
MIGEILDLTKKLVLFHTTENRRDELQRCLDFISGYLSSYNITIKKFDLRDKPSLIATFNGRKKQTLFLNGHIDVVEGSETQFMPKIENGRLYGRGVLDMKAALATFIIIMKELSNRRVKPNVGLMIVSDEEIGGINGTKKLLGKGYKSDFTIIGEPTKLHIKTKHKGSMKITIRAYGRSGHSSRPWKGENAIEKLMKQYFGMLSMLPRAKKSRIWRPTLVITNIRSEGPSNVIPSKAEMVIDARTTDTFTSNKLLNIMDQLKIKYKVDFKKDMMRTNTRNRYVLNLRKIAQKELNSGVKLIKGSGSTDGTYFTQKQMPAIAFGPTGKGHHTHKESVRIDSLNSYYHILMKFIEKNLISS